MPAHRPFLTAALGLALGLGACGGDDGGGGGSSVAVGQEATTEHADTSATDPNAKTTIGITVLTVTKGTQAELKAGGFTLDGDELKATPYYVDAKYTNKGTTPIKKRLSISMEDQDDDLLNSTTVISLGGKPFEKCATESSDDELAPGASYESCELFLVPEGREPKRVSFLPHSPGKPTEFMYWEIP